jgi:hypothetical protein
MSENRDFELFVGGCMDGHRKRIPHGHRATFSRTDYGQPIERVEYRRERFSTGPDTDVFLWLKVGMTPHEAVAALVQQYPQGEDHD